MADLADKRLLQDPATVPEWYSVATPRRRRAAGAGFAVLPRSTTGFYRRPDVWVIPIEDIGPSRVNLIWDAPTANPARDDFVAAALTCRSQTTY